jgi:alpha-mannosidase
LHGTTWTQSLQQLAAITKSMPAPAQQVIEGRGELNHLPDGLWRSHAGDVAHGESPEMVDSAWPVAKPAGGNPNEAI